jgi:hypothetical protein
MDIFGSQRSMA